MTKFRHIEPLGEISPIMQTSHEIATKLQAISRNDSLFQHPMRFFANAQNDIGVVGVKPQPII